METKREGMRASEPPTPWMTLRQTAASLGYAVFLVQQAAEKHRVQHQEWFQVFQCGGRAVEHYAPDLIEQVRTDLQLPPCACASEPPPSQ